MVIVDYDTDIDIDIIKRYGLKPPSNLCYSDTDMIETKLTGINEINTHRLGAGM